MDTVRKTLLPGGQYLVYSHIDEAKDGFAHLKRVVENITKTHSDTKVRTCHMRSIFLPELCSFFRTLSLLLSLYWNAAVDRKPIICFDNLEFLSRCLQRKFTETVNNNNNNLLPSRT